MHKKIRIRENSPAWVVADFCKAVLLVAGVVWILTLVC